MTDTHSTTKVTPIVDEVTQVVNDLEVSLLTPYQLTKVLNIVGSRHGLKTVREQMMYNYRTKGLLGKDLVDGKVPSQSAINFVTKFVEKRVTK